MTKGRPIIFSSAMIRAILEGRKTQTRRIVKPQPDEDARIEIGELGTSRGVAYVRGGTGGQCTRVVSPYGVPGDRLWVRETWRPDIYDDSTHYFASHPSPDGVRWKPSIHMPRWASRITLEVTGVRVERLQEISERDAQAEGVQPVNIIATVPGGVGGGALTAREQFTALWSSINGADSWGANPWIWVVEFKKW